MEIIDLQEDVSYKMYRSVSTEEFWSKDIIDKCPKCKQLVYDVWFDVQLLGIIFKN
jgi:hypothetical protein